MRILPLLLAATLAALPAIATTTVATPTVSNTQALIDVTTNQAGNCTFRISTSATLSPQVYDVDASLFAGANSDARPGAIITGSHHSFLAGTRQVNQAAGGKWLSRSLAAYTQHYGGVTCGSDAEVTFSFFTHNIPTGNTWVDPIQYDANALGGYALPTVEQGVDINDPYTGYTYRYLTGAGEHTWGTFDQVSAGAAAVVGRILTNTNWSNPNNALSLDGSSATYSAVAQDILTIRMASTVGPGNERGSYGWANGGDWHTRGIDSMRVNLTGSGNGSTINVQVAASYNGVDQATKWATVTLPTTSGSVSYPASLSTLLPAAWQDATYQNVPAIMFQVTMNELTVTASGTGVTANAGQFSLDPRIFRDGSKITLGTTEYTVASVDSATHITLTGSAGSYTGAATVSNFALLVRKAAAAAGTIVLDGATVTMAYSSDSGLGGSGFQQWCSPVTATDSHSNVGRFCTFPGSNGVSMYWITEDLQSHFIGRGVVPASSIGNPADEYVLKYYGTHSQYDASDPNSWYLVSTLVSTGGVTLIKATYHPEGVSGCAVPADYAAFPRPGDWNESLDNCNIVFTELTRPSQGHDILSNLNSDLRSKYSSAIFEFVQNGTAVLAYGGGPDHEMWMVHVSLATGQVTGQFSIYMNQGEGSCRFCLYHGPGPSSSSDGYYYIITNSADSGSTDIGGGPNQLTVATPLAPAPAMNRSTCNAAVSGSSAAWYVPYSDGCDTITLQGSDNIPCDPNPAAAELTAGVCSWHAGWSKWQGGVARVGDRIVDYGAGGFEEMILLKNTSATTWIVARNVYEPQGDNMTSLETQKGLLYLRSHAANWTATMLCTYRGNIFVPLAETNGTGLVWDRTYEGFPHAVLRHPGIAVAGTGDLTVKLGQYPAIANNPITETIYNNSAFAGKVGVGLTQGFGQSHVGWAATKPATLTDMSPLAPPNGNFSTLWNQPGVTNPSGTLYRIPAANAFLPLDKRRKGQAVWSGMWNFQDVSGTGSIGGTSSDAHNFCSIDYVGDTCGQSPEGVGDVFMNVPQATNDGNTGGGLGYNRINSAPLGHETQALVEYVLGGTGATDGSRERRLTTAGMRYNGSSGYANAKILENSNIMLFSSPAGNLQRIDQVAAGRVLPVPASEAGNDFMLIPITVASANYAELQFGYAEFGAPTSFHCTSRKEACRTTTHAVPFEWEGERSGTSGVKTCVGGCTINVPALPDHTVYYRIRTSADGSSWSNGALSIAMAPQPDPDPCLNAPTLSGLGASVSTASGTGSFTATFGAGGCAWTVSSSGLWLTVTSSSSGTGNTTVTFSYSANNTGVSRSASITINGAAYTVSQAGASVDPCLTVPTLLPTSASVGASSGTGTLTATFAAGGCAWTVLDGSAWLLVTSANSGTGNTTVHYSYAQNDGSTRGANITINGASHLVTQAGAAVEPPAPTPGLRITGAGALVGKGKVQ